jgi:Mrp family chromosome partitioning ATPase
MDADIYGPSVPIMFGVRGERPMMKEAKRQRRDCAAGTLRHPANEHWFAGR